MTDITPAAELARESARTSTGQFGHQEHSTPEVTLTATDPKRQVVDRLLAERIGRFPDTALTPDALSIGDLRQLMLDAIDQHQTENPAVVVIDGEGKANDAAGVEVIDLDYLGEFYDDGGSAQSHIERATEDLEQLEAAGLSDSRGAYQLWTYLGEELYRDHDLDWYDEEEVAIRGVYGQYALVHPLVDGDFSVVRIEDGEPVGSFATFTDARTAALAAGEEV